MDAALSETETVYNNKQKSWFFGAFASMPSKFYITGGEKKLIDRAIKLVKETVGEPESEAGLEHFSKEHFNTIKDKIPYERNMTDTVFGLVFGDVRENEKAEAERMMIDLKKKLFVRVKPIFGSFECDEILAFRAFTLDSVNVSFNTNGLPQGSITCSFCDDRRSASDIKIFYRLIGNSGSWILSNLISHLERCHTPRNSEHLEFAENTEDVPGTKCKRLKKNAKSKQNNKKTSERNTTIELVIQPIATKCEIDTVELESEFYSQMKQQIIKMGNIAAKNHDEFAETVLGTAGKGTKIWKTIKYCQVSANGNCFFLSMSHQFFGCKIGSEQHIQHATELRQNVVSHIKEHFRRFQHELKGRVYDTWVDGADDDIDKACHDFIESYITDPPIWGGIEAIKALSEILKVNIIAVNDDGTCNMPSQFDMEKERSLLLFFQSLSQQKGNNNDRIHYDSVISLSDVKLKEFAKELTLMEIKHQTLASNDLSHISIDSMA